MKSSTKQKDLSSTEVQTTAHQLSITFALQDSGQVISMFKSSQTKSQSAWHSSKSLGSKKVLTTRTLTRTAQHTLQSLDKLHQLIGMTLTVTKTKAGIWCDYCKAHYGTEFEKGRRQAVWTVVSVHPKSKNEKRHYCFDCAVEVSLWPDGTHWPLTEQVDSILKQEELPSGVQS